MKLAGFWIGAAVGLLTAAQGFGQEFRVGSKVTDFNLNDLKNSPVSYSSLKGNTTVVAFIATRCPVSNAYNERMENLYKEYSAKGVKFIFVNANRNEDAAEVKEHAKSSGFTFPVYKDQGSAAAERFGAQVTPETYVIDRSGIVRYHGSIDDSQNPARIHTQGLRAALDAVLAGREVKTAETKAFGCTIKRSRGTT